MRNILGKIPKKDKQEIADEIKQYASIAALNIWRTGVITNIYYQQKNNYE